MPAPAAGWANGVAWLSHGPNVGKVVVATDSDAPRGEADSRVLD
ncbi:MAG TPA: hypothetical protein VL308_08140 [Gemmatimonadaceae bacterium]|nr:hypothetical protein [Gemmatimonadaceae bacterium]